MKAKTLTSKRKVRFQDCDPFNHLNNSKYIDYFINAREDQMAEFYDLDIFEFTKTQGKAWVVVDHKIAYVTPAVAMEEVIIESQLLNFSDKSISIEMKMYNTEKTSVKSIIWTTFVLLDLRTKRPANHDQNFMDFFAEVHLPVEECDFNNRVQTLKRVA